MKRALLHSSTGRALAILLLPVFLGLAATDSAQAQRRPGNVGVGAQIGEPSGLSLLVYDPRRMSYDFLAAWDLDDFFFLNVHGIYERHLDNTQNLHFFNGPGAFIGVRDRPRPRDDDVEAGVSATFGLGILIERIELYARITPRLTLIPRTDRDFGGGLGIRFYF